MKNTEINDFIKKRVGEDSRAYDPGFNKILSNEIQKKFKVTLSTNAVRNRRLRIGLTGKPKEEELPLSPQEKILRDRQVRKLQAKDKEDSSKYKEALKQVEALEREIEASLQIKNGISPFVIEHKLSLNDSEATAVVLASDWHLEEQVKPETVNGLNKYTLAIAEKRVMEFFQNTLKLVETQQHSVRIETLVIALLGDIISGNIHEELLENCQVTPIEAIIIAENLVISGINYILNNSKLNLVILCHVGNHTRITRKVHISTEKGNSLETFMYHHLANYFKGNERITFQIADGYLSYLKVYDFTICFQHGHAIKYGGGVGGITIPANKAVAQWQKLKHADLYCFGHFHQFIDGGNFICNGSLIGYNAFAIFIKGGFEKPKQTFFLIDKKRGCKTVVCPVMFSI